MRASWYAIPLFLLSAACSTRQQSPDALYRDALNLRRTGRLKNAIEESSLGERRYPDPSSAWHWRFRLLSSELLLDRGETKQALAALSGPSKPADPDLEARWKKDLGDTLFWLTQWNEANRYLEEASRLAEHSSDAGLRAEIEIRRAPIQKTFEQTEACYRSARRFAAQADDLFLLSMAYGGFGYNRIRSSRYDEAIPWLEAMHVTAEKYGALRLMGIALGNLGLSYARLGDFDRGLKLLDQATSIATQLGDKRAQQISLSNMGDIYQRHRDFNNAISCLRRAWALAEDREDKAWLATVFNRLASLYLETGDVRSAARFSEQSLALLSRHDDPRLRVYSELIAARIAGVTEPFPQAEAALRRVIDSARSQNEPRPLWEAHAVLASLSSDYRFPRKAETEYRSAIHTIDAEWSKLRSDETKITFLADLIRFYQQYVDFLMSQGQPAEALRVAESARARVLEERLERSEAVDNRRGFAGLQSALANSRTVLLVYWLAPRRSLVWLIAAGKLVTLPLPGDVELDRMVGDYTNILVNRRDPLERPYAATAQLYETLLKPIQPYIKPGSNVVIVPDGALHNLNFEALVVNDAKPRYWIDDVSISVAPSLSTLQVVSPPASGHPRLLFIGDPVPPGNEYPALPHLKEEREIVERLFPVGSRGVYWGPEATPEAYRDADPRRFDVIHFAAHAVPNLESPLNSAVVLSSKEGPYKLYAKDVLNLPIAARLVTVSACRAAGPRVYSGEGLMGFSWAFLEAGAQHVIAGLWDVDDKATAQLMGDLYAGVARGVQPVDALRAAKLRLLHSGSLYRKPFFWAPFELFTRFVN